MKRWVALAALLGSACTGDETGTLSLLPAPAADAAPARPACTGPAECPDEAPFCLAGRCSECAADGDCSSGSDPRCSTSLGRCVECSAHADCTDGARVWCGPSGLCVECLSDLDCSEPDRPGCLAAEGRCEPCSRDEHCSEGELCSIGEGQCR